MLGIYTKLCEVNVEALNISLRKWYYGGFITNFFVLQEIVRFNNLKQHRGNTTDESRIFHKKQKKLSVPQLRKLQKYNMEADTKMKKAIISYSVK